MNEKVVKVSTEIIQLEVKAYVGLCKSLSQEPNLQFMKLHFICSCNNNFYVHS